LRASGELVGEPAEQGRQQDRDEVDGELDEVSTLAYRRACQPR
jgi:hypothetical protein